MTFVLDKLKFIDRLDLSVPNCVLFEVAQSRNIDVVESKLESMTYRAKVYSLIKSKKPEIIRVPLNQESLPTVAAFLNPEEVKWTARQIATAFVLIWNKYWSKKPTQELITETSSYGYVTPDRMDSVTPVVLYTILRGIGIRTLHTTTFDAMKNVVSMIRSTYAKVVRNISMSLTSYRSAELLSIALALSDCPQKDENRCDIEEMSATIKNVSTRNYMKYNIVPKTAEEAAALAIVFYHTDISSSSDPLTEYALLSDGKPFRDSNMNDLLKCNSDIFDTTISFNPSLPFNAYTEKSLIAILAKEGIATNDGKDNARTYGKLIYKYSVPSFHYGVVRGTKTYETAIKLKDVRECDKPRVSYGCEKDGYHVHLATELTSMFLANGKFCNPRGNEDDIFTRDEIYGLRRICRYGKEKDKDKRWTNLLETIMTIEKALICGLQDASQNFIDKCITYSPEERTIVKDLLYYIMYAGFYMRGWDGLSIDTWPIKNPLPLRDPKGALEKSLQCLMFICEGAKDEVSKYVMQLPLIGMSGTTVNVVTDGERGLTIRGRINIILSRENIHSCTKMSSNYLVITAHHYLTIMGEVLPFSTHDVTII